MPSSSALRVARFRERQRAYRMVLTIELDEIEHVAVLIEARQLDPNRQDDREAIAKATERFLEVFQKEKQQ
jgi:hypothetical protein